MGAPPFFFATFEKATTFVTIFWLHGLANSSKMASDLTGNCFCFLKQFIPVKKMKKKMVEWLPLIMYPFCNRLEV